MSSWKRSTSHEVPPWVLEKTHIAATLQGFGKDPAGFWKDPAGFWKRPNFNLLGFGKDPWVLEKTLFHLQGPSQTGGIFV